MRHRYPPGTSRVSLPIDVRSPTLRSRPEFVVGYGLHMFIIENGTKLPAITGVKHDGTPGDMVASVAGKWAAVLLYRGDW